MMAVIPSRYRAPWQIQNALRYEREDGIPCFSGWGKKPPWGFWCTFFLSLYWESRVSRKGRWRESSCCCFDSHKILFLFYVMLHLKLSHDYNQNMETLGRFLYSYRNLKHCLVRNQISGRSSCLCVYNFNFCVLFVNKSCLGQILPFHSFMVKFNREQSNYTVICQWQALATVCIHFSICPHSTRGL